MSLMKSSFPLTVYRAESSTLASITSDRIRQFAFRSIDNLPDEKGYGFVNADDMFDLDWHTSEKGHDIRFSRRRQKDPLYHPHNTSERNVEGRTRTAGRPRQEVHFKRQKKRTP